MKINKLLIFLIFAISILLLSCKEKIKIESKIVAIQPYDNFSKSETKKISKLISVFYKIETIILKSKEIDKKAFVNFKTPRFRADSIIKFQKKELFEKYNYIVGLTNNDISTTKTENGKVKIPECKYSDWGVMGLAYCPGNSGVVSSFRIKNKNQTIYFDRLQKIVLHELGHNFGLPHCKNKKCLMTDAVENIATIDNARLNICLNCKNILNFKN
jgi:archaemetzincin